MAQFALQHSSHLKLGKLLSLVAGILCIDELGEEELTELRALGKANIKEVRMKVYDAHKQELSL